MDFNSAVTLQLNKLVENIDDLARRSGGRGVVMNYIDEIMNYINAKVNCMKEFASLTLQLNEIEVKPVVRGRTTSICDPFSPPKKEAKENDSFSTFSQNVHKSSVCSEKTPPFDRSFFERKGSSRGFMMKKSDTDLRRLALLNCMNEFRKTCVEIEKPASPSLDSIHCPDIEKKPTSKSSVSSPANPGSEVSSPSDKDFSFEVNFFYTKDLKAIFNVIDQVCASPKASKRKPFDKTEDEEQMDNIFKNSRIPQKANTSFVDELMESHEFEEDHRLNSSCVYEYSLETYFNKGYKHRKCNSLVIAGRRDIQEDFAFKLNQKQ